MDFATFKNEAFKSVAIGAGATVGYKLINWGINFIATAVTKMSAPAPAVTSGKKAA